MNATETQSAGQAVSWTTECLRALAILLCSSLLALGINAFSKNPVPLLAADGPGALPDRAPRIMAAQLKEAMAANKALVLDVRREETFEKAHPAHAINAPAENFIEHYGRLNLGAHIAAAELVVIVCDSELCPSGDRVAKLLESMNHKNVRVLQGGWEAYVAAGLEKNEK